MLFSILMCTYNSAATLMFSIDSVRNQISDDWEMVILDNGSKDDTVKILKEYQKQDKRIKCIFRKQNVGWAKGISICLESAKGQYMSFLAADDLLFHNKTLVEVQNEITEYQPDIIWTGYTSAEFDFDKKEFRVLKTHIPEYRRYEKEDKLTQIIYIMQKVYYASMMHYVRIDFLKKHGIDFYYPWGGDMQGMTEALCQAEKMIVLDKPEYVLTRNTSQTALSVGYDFDYSRHWKSIKAVVPEINYFQKTDSLQYIANIVLQPPVFMLENIMKGKRVCDSFMNTIYKDFPERFKKAEEWILSDAFGEMMYYAGREIFTKRLINAAGVLYWRCKTNNSWIMKIRAESQWLAEFVELVFEGENIDKLKWRRYFSARNAEVVLEMLYKDVNKHRIGAELLLRDDIIFENMEIRVEIEKCLNEYLNSLQSIG